MSGNLNVLVTGATGKQGGHLDRKSTRLNSSHSQISYAVFCLNTKAPDDQVPPGDDLTVNEHDSGVQLHSTTGDRFSTAAPPWPARHLLLAETATRGLPISLSV